MVAGVTEITIRPDLGGVPAPQHVAFIMDGNGRWARERGLDRTEGHRRGVETVRTILECCRTWGIRYSTLYAFSTENWKRPESEIGVLFGLMADYLEANLPKFLRDDIRLHLLGNDEGLPEPALTNLHRTLEQTRHCDTWHVLLAVNYGGRDEIVRAARRMLEDPDRPTPSELDETRFSAYLDTAGIPDPDLMIRTSGEIRLSNFMLWQLAYAEFVFVPEYWPDFDEARFARALEEYARRDRRFGMTGEQAAGQGA
ncbi:MAG: di-trans,poly-cis-decaprenylcistransferase [Candidatus Dadabacteria bacterium]|nr:MAG: di-trans,poly-cis-decaprenylcistransferase [Candidatus Dadabacteria bacterium]